MKTSFLKLDNPCRENWDNMKPKGNGSFCEQCAKTVIDFTVLDEREIAQIMKKSNGNVCARVTKKQLMVPMFDSSVPRTYELPYSNVAAGLMIATSLVATQPTQAENYKERIELSASKDTVIQNKVMPVTQKSENAKLNNPVVFKGKVRFKNDGKPIENAKIMLVTVKAQLVTYTKADGAFALQIPAELIDDDNVIRVTYEDVRIGKKPDPHFYGYETEDYILTKKELESEYRINAEEEMMYLGGMRAYSEESPIVLSKGHEIDYKEFIKARNGKKSTCNLEDKSYLYFESKAAIAIYGQKARQGLYIITQKSPEKTR